MYAIRRANGDVLYFDAVTNIEEQYTSTVTKHPVATGGYISDHTIRDNKKFSLSAVLSDADFNLDRPPLTGGIMGTGEVGEGGTGPGGAIEETGEYVLDPDTGYYERRSVPRSQQKQYQNNTPTNITVSIEPSKGSNFKKFLPETISQFTGTDIPTVTVAEQAKVKPAESVRDELIYMWEVSERFMLLEYENNIVTRQWVNVVFTNLSFAQDADTGLGLFPVMQLEQVTFTDTEHVPIIIRKTPNKGRKSGDVTKKPTEKGDDAATEPTNKSEKTALRKMQTNTA